MNYSMNKKDINGIVFFAALLIAILIVIVCFRGAAEFRGGATVNAGGEFFAIALPFAVIQSRFDSLKKARQTEKEMKRKAIEKIYKEMY